MAGVTISRTAHFALHRVELDASSVAPARAAPEPSHAQALFAVSDTWVGALIPKRWAKRAVTRNAIKRQIYTVTQALASQLLPAAHVVRLRAGFDRQQFISAASNAFKRAVRDELQELFARAAP
jgi:ribonuclease P protein component